MRYNVCVLTVDWSNGKSSSFTFYELHVALEAAWEIRESPVVKNIKLKAVWKELPAWIDEIVKAGSV